MTAREQTACALYRRAARPAQVARRRDRGLERIPHAEAEIGDAGIVTSEIGIRHVLEIDAGIPYRRDVVAELEAFVKQHAGAEPDMVARDAAVGPVVDRAAEAQIAEKL